MSRQQTNIILKASHYFVRFMQLSCVGVTITKNLGVAHPSRTQLPAEQFLFSKESASKHPKDIRGVQLFLYIKYIKDLRKILSWLKIWINFLWYKSVIFFYHKAAYTLERYGWLFLQPAENTSVWTKFWFSFPKGKTKSEPCEQC